MTQIVRVCIQRIDIVLVADRVWIAVLEPEIQSRHLAASFLRDALALFNDLPDPERYGGGILLAEALFVMKREAEAKTLLMKTYENHARKHGEQNPYSARARRRLEQLGTPKASQNRLR